MNFSSLKNSWRNGTTPAASPRAWWLLCICLLLRTPQTAVPAEQPKPTEYQVKAAYLYNFGKFVNWPPEAHDSGHSFSICVLGQDPFGKALDETLTNASWDGKNVTAKRIARVEEATGCEVLFISSSEAEQLSHILATVEKLPILTVSDTPQFARRGGDVEFVLSDNRVRFEVNLEAAERSGLSLSSQLLKVAVRVRHGNQAGER